MIFLTIILVELVKQVPVIEKIAFIVIGVLGLKLVLSVILPGLTSEFVDLIFSLLTLVVFVTPVVVANRIPKIPTNTPDKIIQKLSVKATAEKILSMLKIISKTQPLLLLTKTR